MFDTLYYSNHCKHSQRVLQYLVKSNLVDKISFINIDNRKRDKVSNQLFIVLEDGQRVVMPPHVKSVPSLLLVKENYRVIVGDDIIDFYQPHAQKEGYKKSIHYSKEPIGTPLIESNRGVNIFSEPYSLYNLTPEELSAKGTGGRRQMYNYVSANEDIISIYTPDDDYQPDKVEKELTVESLQQRRIDDLNKQDQNPSLVSKL